MFSHPDFFRTCILEILSSIKSQTTHRWQKIQHKMAEAKISISPTRGQHFFTIQSNLSFNEKPKISTAKESQSTYLYTPQILFLRGAFIFFSYGNSGLYSNAVLTFIHPVSSTYIAIFTVERTRISEWSVYDKTNIHLSQKPQQPF